MIIHYINHNFTDWDSQTKHMSRIEKSIFLDLRSMYFANASIQNGKIEASDFELLAYRLSCNTDEEKTALAKVLKDKFKKIGKAYRLAKWDYVIRCIAKKYGHKGQPPDSDVTLRLDTAMTYDVTHDVTGTDNAKDSDVTKSRQQKSNQKKKHMIELLKSIGVQANTRMGIIELTALCDGNNIHIHNNAMTDDVTHDVTVTDNAITDIDTQIRDITNNQEPINQEPNIYISAENFQNSESVDNLLAKNLYPIFNPDIDTLNTWFLRAGVPKIEDNIEYRQELTRFNLHFAGHTKHEVEGFWFGKMITWFGNVHNRNKTAQQQRFNIDNEDWNNPQKPVYSEKTNYHPSHSKPTTDKLDPSTSVLLNGLWRPCLPNMTQQQTYTHVEINQDAGESQDETYDRLVSEISG